VNRWRDWWEQSARDLTHARHAVEDGDHGWAAFAAPQAAEKALKALVMAGGGEPRGHRTTRLAESVPPGTGMPPSIVDASRRLDRRYVPSRCPNGFAEGFPGQSVHEGRSGAGDAALVVEFCRRHLPG
jgi:HEPN domain-containing protein